MTDEQALAVVRSLAVELSRLSHGKQLPEDNDEHDFGECMDLALLMRIIPTLCSHHISGLVDLVLALDTLQEEGLGEEHRQVS